MNKIASALLLATALVGPSLAASTSAVAAGNEFYISIQGQKQGKFRGESVRKGQETKIVGLALDYSVKSPRDSASGQATGKRQHSPVTITKEWGAATPQLFQALVTNETLPVVLFEFVRPGKGGAEEIFQVVKLTNAQILAVSHHTGAAPLPETKRAANEMLGLEDISFTFDKIEMENKLAGTSSSDTVDRTP